MATLIAIVGAESTGKTALAQALAGRLSGVAVPELLRAWCDREGRTPRPDEQADIAAAQTAAIDAAALAFHRRCALTLLTALDLPWEADGLQRDGPHVQQPVDAAIRAALRSAGLSWAVIAGQGSQRVDAALNAITALPGMAQKAGLFTRLTARQAAMPEWRWPCDCDVPDCEHAALQLLQRASSK